ncbi:hypothetical protein IDJ75_10755 [Mucilaginibacter rigui]|uniref:RHS repeat protein n=1 Tax=Mucilaginibacter rigui TaxID=534635 RepID=A0ABR7X591_9SPHI|nr:hypothetical protein [Mucilaginibacter rigui]MBD1385759.1 hypothetical protein [Mucilaginibacter rigui]
MNNLLRSFILLVLMGISVKGVCQITADDIREGLKGKVATMKKIDYSIYPDIESISFSLFDAQGRIINAVYSDSVQSLGYIWKFRYDGGKKLLGLTKLKNGKIISIYTNIYDAKGNLVQQNLATNDRTYFKPVKYFFKYNKQGQLIEVYNEEYGIDINPSKKIFTYDKNGLRVTQSTYNNDGYLKDKAFMMYNGHQDIIKNVHYYDVMSPDKFSTSLYSYTYDKKGNWIVRRKKERYSNKFEIIQTRKITYH